MEKKNNIGKYVIGILLALAAYFGGRMIGTVSGNLMKDAAINADSAKDYTNQTLKEMFESDDYYNDVVSGIVEELVNQYGADQEIATEYAAAYWNLAKQVKYTVMDPTEVSEKRYAVTITYQPILDPFTIAEREEEYSEKAIAAGLDTLEEPAYTNKMIEIYTEIYEEYAGNPSYGKEKSLTIYYAEQSDGNYGFSEEDAFMLGQEIVTFAQE